MHTTPSTPLAAAPEQQHRQRSPVEPSHPATRNASAIPGSVAWLSASVISERFRSNANTPIMPAATPAASSPRSPMFVLNPARNVSVSSTTPARASSSVTS
jgi:hypothetical protein